MDELRARIAADIQKSGFGSEMRALRLARDAGWVATGSVHYVDLDTGLARESDIEAHHVISESSDNERVIHYQSFFSLSVEVKKSEKPWIVFRETPEYGFQLYEGKGSLYFCAGVQANFRKGMSNTIGESGLPKRVGWYGNGLHEAFKNPDQPSRWYSAFTSVCKAAEYELEQNSWELSSAEDDGHFPYFWLSRPVVVLDGLLFSADLNEREELSLTEEKFCSVKFAYTSEHYRRKQYFVDVVTLRAFREYLDLSAERNVKFAASLQKLAGYGRKPAGTP